MSNKNDLIGVVADKAGLTKADAALAVDAVFDAVTASLKKGEEVRLVGFGTFAVSKRKASIGRNPATGAEIKIPASNQAKLARQGASRTRSTKNAFRSTDHMAPCARRRGHLLFGAGDAPCLAGLRVSACLGDGGR